MGFGFLRNFTINCFIWLNMMDVPAIGKCAIFFSSILHNLKKSMVKSRRLKRVDFVFRIWYIQDIQRNTRVIKEEREVT